MKPSYFVVANWGIAEEIYKYGQENINTLGQQIMHMCIHNTLIPNMLEVMSNGKTKAKILKKYGLTTLFQYTVVECIINVGFKYDYDVKNYYVYGHEKKDTIW